MASNRDAPPGVVRVCQRKMLTQLLTREQATGLLMLMKQRPSSQTTERNCAGWGAAPADAGRCGAARCCGDSDGEDAPLARALSETSGSRQLLAPQGLVVTPGPQERDVPMAMAITD